MSEEIREDDIDDTTGEESKFLKARELINTPEEIKIADKYRKIYENRKEEMGYHYTQWEELQELYAADLDTQETNEYGFVNIILPSVEGQVSAMTNQNVSATFKGKGFSDQKFARAAEVIFPSIFAENNIRQKLKRGIRRYCLFGNMWFKLDWDADAWDGFGVPDFKCLPLTRVLWDGKIKDMLDFQKGDYVIEEIPQSIDYVRDNYDNGEELAEAISLGNEFMFGTDSLTDDDKSFTLIQIWRKHPKTKNLQKIEVSRCGVYLEGSDENTPYYEKVHNKYPYFPAGLYPLEDEFMCFGDGKLLKPVQQILNNLYHEVILACKFAAQRRTFIDPNAGVDPNEFDGNPDHPIFCKNPHQFVYDQQGVGINPVVLQMIEHLLMQAEKMIRFSALMTGNNSGEKMTATQAGIQQQQGVSGVDDKKADISTPFGDAVLYALGMCMELWPAGKAFRLTEEPDKFEWVDARQLANIPEMVPVDSDFTKRYREKHPNTENMPQFMQLEYDEDETDEEGNPLFETDDDGITPKLDENNLPIQRKKHVFATKQIELDVSVSIGEGLPTNKMALYNIILTLAQLQLPDERTGQMRSLLSFNQVKKMVEDYLCIKIEDYMDDPDVRAAIQAQQGQSQNGQPGVVNINPNIPGANLNGNMGGGGI